MPNVHRLSAKVGTQTGCTRCSRWNSGSGWPAVSRGVFAHWELECFFILKFRLFVPFSSPTRPSLISPKICCACAKVSKMSFSNRSSDTARLMLASVPSSNVTLSRILCRALSLVGSFALPKFIQFGPNHYWFQLTNLVREQSMFLYGSNFDLVQQPAHLHKFRPRNIAHLLQNHSDLKPNPPIVPNHFRCLVNRRRRNNNLFGILDGFSIFGGGHSPNYSHKNEDKSGPK